ncbi:MAG TPA: glycosyltransferase family 2 protein [Burkholderiaceae bacterium]|jgi:dolichol-phosphate mannosyltransferase|nr:glycosyltransferase family 2 protein [Burkholderiaceae bacterium]
MDQHIDVSVIIPVYNNARSLQELGQRLDVSLSSCAPNYEVIFINDGSRDDSTVELHKLCASNLRFKAIILSRNFGQHPAICAGFEHARGESVILMDADLQDSPEHIPALLEALQRDDADIVYTIRKTADRKISTRLSSALYHRIFSKIVNTDVPVNIGTFRAFKKNVLHALLQFREVNVLYGPLMFYIGYRAAFVELPYIARPHGVSSYTFRKRLKLAANSLISYTDIPHRLSMYFGGLLLTGCVIYSLMIILQYAVFGASLPSGSTLILLVLCLTLGSIMVSLGIIGSYLFRVYEEVLRRPRYLVQDMVNVKKMSSNPCKDTA